MASGRRGVKVTIQLPSSVRDAVKKRAAEQGTTVSVLLRTWVSEALGAEEPFVVPSQPDKIREVVMAMAVRAAAAGDVSAMRAVLLETRHDLGYLGDAPDVPLPGDADPPPENVTPLAAVRERAAKARRSA